MGTVPYLAEQEQLDGECQAQARIIGIVWVGARQS